MRKKTELKNQSEVNSEFQSEMKENVSLDKYDQDVEQADKRRDVIRLIGLIVIEILVAAMLVALCRLIVKAASPEYTDKPLPSPNTSTDLPIIDPDVSIEPPPIVVQTPWVTEPVSSIPSTLQPDISPTPIAQWTAVPTATPMPTPYYTPIVVTPVPTPVYTPVVTPVPTPPHTPVVTPTLTPTQMPSPTPEATPELTPEPSAEPTEDQSPTA